MLRAGASLPVVMKLLGHQSPKMTMRYLDVSLADIEREFMLAQQHPRHLVPVPKSSFTSSACLSGLVDSLQAAQHVLEMFRRSLLNDTVRIRLNRLANRLTKILIEARNLATP